MAQFNELTPEQQVTILHYADVLLRPAAGEMARVNVRMAAVNADYVAQASAAIALLDAGAEIPDESGLSGTSVLDKEAVITLTSYVDGFLAFNTATHRQNLTLAAGAENTIG